MNAFRKQREKADMTQAQVAKAAGVFVTVISKLETGNRRLLASEVKKYADILGCSVEDLLEEEPTHVS